MFRVFSPSRSDLKRFLLSVIFGSVIGFLFVGYAVYAAFTAPTAASPGANVPAPLNVGSAAQTKEGGLWIARAPVDPGLLVENGNVGIGTITPESRLQIDNGYLQIDTTSGPPGPDCNNPAEEGRMIFDPVLNFLYICNGSGWVKATFI